MNLGPQYCKTAFTKYYKTNLLTTSMLQCSIIETRFLSRRKRSPFS